MTDYVSNFSTLGSRMSQDTALAFGSHIVTVAEAAAQALELDTHNPAGVHGWQVQVYRAGVNIQADAVVSTHETQVRNDATCSVTPHNWLDIANGSTFNLAAGDVINWIVF